MVWVIHRKKGPKQNEQPAQRKLSTKALDIRNMFLRVVQHADVGFQSQIFFDNFETFRYLAFVQGQ